MVTMSRTAFDSLDSAELAWACIEPTIGRMRGKAPEVKKQVYAELTAGQRALLMFWILHGHARHGVIQFYQELAYLLVQTDIWGELKAGMGYFRDDAMLRLVEKMEAVCCRFPATDRQQGRTRSGVDAEGLDGNTELRATIDRLDVDIPQATQSLVERIGKHIRENPGEFLLIEG